MQAAMAHRDIGHASCSEVREICYDGLKIAGWRHTVSKVAEKQGFDSQQRQGLKAPSISRPVRALNMVQNVHAVVGINGIDKGGIFSMN